MSQRFRRIETCPKVRRLIPLFDRSINFASVTSHRFRELQRRGWTLRISNRAPVPPLARWFADSIRLECLTPHVNGFVNAVSQVPTTGEAVQRETGNASRSTSPNSARTDLATPKARGSCGDPGGPSTRHVTRWLMRRGMSIAEWHSREALAGTADRRPVERPTTGHAISRSRSRPNSARPK